VSTQSHGAAEHLVPIDDGVVRHGRVASWDDARGLGAIAGADGSSLEFHCTAIADGSRTISEGATVAYTTVAGRLGRAEAGVVAPV
jgi:cold shock CspA family protein